MNNKITKQDIWTEIKILNAKLDLIIDLLKEKEEVEQVKNEVAVEILKTPSDPMDEYFKKLAEDYINKQASKVHIDSFNPYGVKTIPFKMSGDLSID